MPKVSVIIPAYKASRTIAKAIKSVQQQTFRDVEIIVVDDCSPDDTYEVMKSLAVQDPSIKILRLEQNGGAGAARNMAMENATGEWIALLDADDWFEPERLQVMLDAAGKFQADVVYDNLKIYDHVTGKIVDRTHHGRRGEVTLLSAKMFIDRDNTLWPYAIGYMQPMFKRDFVRRHNLKYDAARRSGEDFIFQLELLLCGAKNIIVPGAYYIYLVWISPTTGAKSPFSHSMIGNSDLIARGCDLMLEKYARTLTGPERVALIRRRKLFASRMQCDLMMAALREKKFLSATKILIGTPFILVHNAFTIIKLLRAKILSARVSNV